jgi:cysteine desulfurase
MIYFDYAATTPPSQTALNTYVEVARNYFGNASSLHDIGSAAQYVLDACRQQFAQCIGAEEEGIYFTGGGSESNDLAIRSLVYAHQDRGRHLISTKVEHPSVLNTFALLAEQGFEVSYVPVNEYGEVSVEALQNMITERTILVSIPHVNSEIGTIQPLARIAALLAERDILLHADMVQSLGKLPLDLKRIGVDSASFSSHKVYGPKGVGACYISPGRKWRSLFPHITHERGLRQGTVNVPGIAAFVASVMEVCADVERERERAGRLAEQFLTAIKRLAAPFGKRIVLEGHPTQRLAQHLSLRLEGMEGQYLLLACNRYGLAISTGTACQAGSQEPSETMKAIGRTKAEADELIRVTFGRPTTDEELAQAIQIFERVLNEYYGQHEKQEIIRPSRNDYHDMI